MRLPYMAGWSDLSPSSQKGLHRLVKGAVPRCSMRGAAERRAHDQAVERATREEMAAMDMLATRLKVMRTADKQAVWQKLNAPVDESGSALTPAEIADGQMRGRWS